MVTIWPSWSLYYSNNECVTKLSRSCINCRSLEHVFNVRVRKLYAFAMSFRHYTFIFRHQFSMTLDGTNGHGKRETYEGKNNPSPFFGYFIVIFYMYVWQPPFTIGKSIHFSVGRAFRSATRNPLTPTAEPGNSLDMPFEERCASFVFTFILHFQKGYVDHRYGSI